MVSKCSMTRFCLNSKTFDDEPLKKSPSREIRETISNDPTKPIIFVLELPSIVFTRYQRSSTSGPGIAINGKQFKFSFNE
jgi:hypothetical protein